MQRLAADPHYFAKPDKALFQDIRRYFPITVQAQVAWAVNQGVDAAVSFVEEQIEIEDLLRVDPATETAQVERLKAFKADRDQELVASRLQALRDAAAGTDNLVPPIKDALRDRASMGEVCGAMKDVFGEYRPDF